MNQQQIAKHFGISQSTVSIALSRSASNRVSQQLRKAIMDYCRENAPEYLRAAKHWNIGFAAHNKYCENPFYAELFSGVSQIASEFDYSLILANEKNIIRQCRNNNLDGVIDARQYWNTTEELPPEIPHVMLNNADSNLACDCIMPDNFAVIRLAFEYLLKNTHQRIGFLTIYPCGKTEPLSIHMSERKNAYLEQCRIHNIKPLLINIQSDHSEHFLVEFTQYLQHLKSENKLPDALLIPDTLASEVLKALRLLDISIPEDISLVSWDNCDKFSSKPFMTSIDFNLEHMGMLAMETLLWRIDHPDAPCRRINIAPKLIERASVKKY